LLIFSSLNVSIMYPQNLILSILNIKIKKIYRNKLKNFFFV